MAMRRERVDDGSGGLLLREVELGDGPQPGTDSALPAAGPPTLTALDVIREAPDRLVPQQRAAAGRDRRDPG